VTHEKSSVPIRAKGADGKLADIDKALTKRGERLEPKVAAGDVSISATGKGELGTYKVDEGQTVGVEFSGDLGAPEVKGSGATYPVAGAEGVTVRAGALADGLYSHVILDKAPTAAPEYKFDLALDGLTAKLDEGVLSLLDGKKVVAQSRPLTMWDSQRDQAGDPSHTAKVDAKLVQGETGTTQLVLSPSAEFLNDPKTKYPVTIDPDLMDVDGRGDTYYFNGQAAGDSRGSDYRLRTGEQDGATHRSLVTFSYEDYVGETIIRADLKLHQYSSATCTAKTSEFVPTIADTTASITWATRPTVDDSARFKASKSYNHGQSGDGCPDADELINVTSIVSAWSSGVINSDTTPDNNRQGIELRASSENDSSHDKRYCSDNDASSGNCDDPALQPTLSVTYAPELGSQDWFSMTDHQLNASSTLSVNNRSGNAYVSATDGGVASRGPSFGVSRAYNSQNPATTTLGKGWNLGFGSDVWIQKRSKHRYDYHAPNGTHFGTFFRETADSGDEDNYDDFISPMGGVGATLNLDFDGNGSGDHNDDPADPDQFKLIMNDSQTVYLFEEQISTGHAYLKSITDRSGNAMTFAYSGTISTGQPKLTTVTDAGGRAYDITYTGAYITKIKENSGLAREWNYTYTNGYLTKYTDPDNKETNYAYTTGFTGPELLNTVTNPANQTGNNPTATISYGYDSNLNIDQVTEVQYAIGASSTFDYTWNYFDVEDQAKDKDGDEACHDHGDFATQVTDPNAKVWTYCFKPRDEAGGERKTWVYDYEERERTSEFNVDKQTETLTSGASGSTVATYGSSKPDQLKTVTDPKSSGSTSGERTNVDYNHEPGAGNPDPKGQDYLPSSVTDPNNDCTRYEYDSTGRLTVAIIELRGSGSDRSCSDDTSGGVKYKYEYNSDGTLAKMADGIASSTPPDSEKTIYTYWASGDANFVAGTSGMLKSVQKPGGNCSTQGPRKLCTSYKYDSSGRVKSVTDGKDQTTTMAYDVLDRTTKVMFNGDTTCASAATCTTYAYDAEGNMTSRVEAAGTTSFTYDRMNRQTKVAQPNDIDFTSTFDGVGNLTGYLQEIGTDDDSISYTYDGGNFVTSISDTAGTITTEIDDDGYIEQYTFPGTNGVEIEYDILDNGKADTATVTADQGAGSELYDINYDYTDGSDDEDQLQNRIVTDAPSGSGLNGTTDYEYEYGQLSAAADSSSAGPSYAYDHDNIGNVTREAEDGTSTYFGYNRTGQLCYESSTDGDNLGTGTACPSAPGGATTFTHDAAGNNLMGGAAYNNRNQVTDLDSLSMGYLDLGNDKRTTVGTTTLADGPLGITGRKTGTTVTWYTRMPDGMILDSRKGSDTQMYFTEPHNQSVTALFSLTGTMTAAYLYSPYGETTIHSEDSGAGTDNPFRYISGWQDTGTSSFYKLGARYYDGHGHFTQPDPVAGAMDDPRATNVYGYAKGDPINLGDPTGLYPGEDAVRWIGRAASSTARFGVRVVRSTPFALATGFSACVWWYTEMRPIKRPGGLGILGNARWVVEAYRVAIGKCLPGSFYADR
jgi:RHS repeat-associated protein